VRRWTVRDATPADWPAIAALLHDAQLPLAGAREHLDGFVLALHEGLPVGCAGLERYDGTALLRSVAVTPAERGRGLGQALVRQMLERAAADGLDTVALLTTTAADFFHRFGFHVIERMALPPAVQGSVEVREACPASATAMLLELGQGTRRLWVGDQA
jgi:amino-acid N-acetyltransferase